LTAAWQKILYPFGCYLEKAVDRKSGAARQD
jgi:hypothetical protein